MKADEYRKEFERDYLKEWNPSHLRSLKNDPIRYVSCYVYWLESKLTEQAKKEKMLMESINGLKKYGREKAKEIEGLKDGSGLQEYVEVRESHHELELEKKDKEIKGLKSKLQSIEKGIENKWVKNFAVRESVKTLRFVQVRKWKG